MIIRRMSRLGMTAGVVVLAGCTVTQAPDDAADGGTFDELRVRVENRTDAPLDPQLYVAPSAEGLNSLFAARNQRTDFGVGRVGVLLPDSSAEFAVACGGAVYIATRGGAFGDDLNNPAGSGEQIVLEEDLNVRCGNTNTFTFENVGPVLITTYNVTSG